MIHTTPHGAAYAHFVGNLPYLPKATDDFTRGLFARTPDKALECAYIQPDKPYACGWLKFDVDRIDACAAWIDQHMPRPHFTVGNPRNGHGHLAWGLKSPVVRSMNGRPAPLKLLTAVEAGVTRLIGADARYTGLTIKTPHHPQWFTQEYDGPLYDLTDLLDALPASVSTRKVERREYVGEGRNVDLFDTVRFWAYGHALDARNAGDYLRWQAAVLSHAQAHNTFAAPLPDREVQSVARSIAQWTWKHAHGLAGSKIGGAKRSKLKSWQRDEMSAQEARERMSQGAHRTHAVMRNRTFDAITDAIGQLAAQGNHTPTHRQLAESAGVSLSTVRRFRAGQGWGGN